MAVLARNRDIYKKKGSNMVHRRRFARSPGIVWRRKGKIVEYFAGLLNYLRVRGRMSETRISRFSFVRFLSRYIGTESDSSGWCGCDGRNRENSRASVIWGGGWRMLARTRDLLVSCPLVARMVGHRAEIEDGRSKGTGNGQRASSIW